MPKATLLNGSKVEYLPDMIGEGVMKQVYFTADKSSVICLYKDKDAGKDRNRLERLQMILKDYNPTLDPETGAYFKKLFCWPTGIVIQPSLGIITPTYPNNFFFENGNLQGKEKESTWFVRSKLQTLLPASANGDWRNYFSICIQLARAVRRLHQAGLAHSDLSNKNVLIDPSNGKGIMIIIDIDSLVVPNLFTPDVLGTRGYIAPEVLSTIHLPLNDPHRKHPCAATDQHALAVLIYQYLLGRHPLEGRKTYPAVSAEEQERLEMGMKALFIEHPVDHSNRPNPLSILNIPYKGYASLGPYLKDLIERSFIKGLHHPNSRPAAIEWERALIKTWDLLYPCLNPQCPSQWFVLHEENKIQCPFCGTSPEKNIPILRLSRQGGQGQWLPDGQIAVYHNLSLHKWHIFDDVFPGEKKDPTPQAYCIFNEGQWLLVNQNMASMLSPDEKLVPIGSAIKLEHGTHFLLSRENHGRRVDVQVVNNP